MNELTQLPIGELVKLGLPGIVILALAWAYWQTNSRLARLHEARLKDREDDLRALMQTMNANTISTNALTEAVRALSTLFQARDSPRTRAERQ